MKPSKAHKIVEAFLRSDWPELVAFVETASKHGKLFMVEYEMLKSQELAEFGAELAIQRMLRMPFSSTIIEFYNTKPLGPDDDDVIPEPIVLFILQSVGRAVNGHGESVKMDDDVAQFVILSTGIIDGTPRVLPGLIYMLATNGPKEFSYFKPFDVPEKYQENKEKILNQTSTISWAIRSFASLINSKSTQTTVSEPPEKLNKARVKKGKAPLLPVRYVDVPAIARDAGRGAGGTHASPRLHWRRGHLRHLPDKIVPVSPCLVGAADNGEVQQIYRARRKPISTLSRSGE